MRGVVLAAIDLGPFSARVLRHAAAFARLLQGRLKVLHVTRDPAPDDLKRVLDFCTGQGPYEVDLAEDDVIVKGGRVSDAIYREAQKAGAELVVIGSRGHGGLIRLMLGSTSDAVLRNAPAPVLLVPPTDLDIADISDCARLTCGPVLAAVDTAESCDQQLTLASRLAELAGQPLLLMTVATSRLDDHAAAALLRQGAHGLEPIRPRSVIVRRGRVAGEISDCAVTEGSGLVVMGLRSKGRGQPGAIASAVLATRRAFVLAVPGC